MIIFGKHGKSLENTLFNRKLPKSDVALLENAIDRYKVWLIELNELLIQLDKGKYEDGSLYMEDRPDCLHRVIESLNIYKKYIDLNVIYDSEHNFLYRNKGQLKLCNTIIEEFLERVLSARFGLPRNNLEVGSIRCVSSMFFDVFDEKEPIKTVNKDQDCAIVKNIPIEFWNIKKVFKIPLVAIECKTYIDKTMFQEAVGTASRMKQLCPRSKYFILAEWLDMTPVDTLNTGIDKIFILRKAKRIKKDFEEDLESYKIRQEKREFFSKTLDDNRIDFDVFNEFIFNIESIINGYDTITTEKVLKTGTF